MKIALISINKKGDEIYFKLHKTHNIELFSSTQKKDFDIKQVTKDTFNKYDAIIFATSTGIAVRMISNLITTKDKDPAIIVIDSTGKFVISLLSGHLGGANELTLNIAKTLGAIPVITTATDNLNLIAPDIIAKQYNLAIDNLKDAKEVSALMVDGYSIAFYDEDKIIPLLSGYSNDLENKKAIVYVTNKEKLNLDKLNNKNCILSYEYSLKLIRKNIVLGIGCRKNFSTDYMKNNVLMELKKMNIDIRAIKSIGTIELKKDEEAIKSLSKTLNCDLKIFTKTQIKAIEDNFLGSDFVNKSIGVKCVCEPCVELMNANIIKHKIKLNGMTLCIGKIKDNLL